MKMDLYSSDIARIGWQSGLNYNGRVPFTVDEMIQACEDKDKAFGKALKMTRLTRMLRK